jgi:predicted ATP-dependent serine protease
MSAVQWTTLSEVQPRPVQWLWEGRIPMGKVTLLDGEPGAGKSLLALDLAARVSRGAAMPLNRTKPGGPADVVLFNADDSLIDTVRPRLESAGADLTRIHCIDGELHAADLPPRNPALIILDPLTVYLCLDRSAQPRTVLKQITDLARDSNAAVLAVQFLPKDGFWASEVFDVARSVLYLSNIGHGRHRVALTKSNLRAPSEIPPFVYNIERAGDSIKISGWADSV